MMDIDIEALAEEVTSAANIVTNDGYYEIDMDAVAKCLDKALATTRAELAALKERERETLAVLQTAHESEAALIAERDRLREMIAWAVETLQEINPSNYGHDDVCALNAASVEVCLGLDSVLTGDPA